jgi:site-specific recombinase XerD
LGWFSEWVDKDWQTVNLNDVRRYKLYLEQERKLKPNSVALALSSLKSFYAWPPLAGYDGGVGAPASGGGGQEP